ncbi:putative membrane protein [Leptospira fainei serovar Hurstbridge str. BUT 6]|uniref:Membrane protein n=1 Tax=Leptospira fainei serovar Hurstbridge str. BUT 6 TaxID=1193011 RepID=S3V1C2_9LEPT|nr:membrane protein [Leptospira fainei]EPG76466.1 putative membrane protein [Leptospira fainei serovar Hurstbridge str. BUT 6]
MDVKVEQNLINYKLDSKTRTALIGMIIVGLVSLAIAAFGFGHENLRHDGGHSNPAWSAYLVGTFFILGISIAGIFFTALGHITGAHWPVTLRRISEGYGMFLPVAGVLLVILTLGAHDLYEWTHEEAVAHDHLLQHKKPLLNMGFFTGILIFLSVVWSAFGYLFYTRSIAQDKDKEVKHTQFNAKLSGGFIVFFALSFSLVSFEVIMSLTPHWFSTMFGVYCFAAAYQAGLSSFVVVAYFLKKKGYLGNLVNENHIHDLGKFMLGFTVFWAYVGFSQFMLIWYANIPEETFFFEQRLTGGWEYLTLAIPAIKFAVPFLLLLNRPNKRDINFLVKVAVWILFTQATEIFWLVYPANFVDFSLGGYIASLGSVVGMIGLFGLVLLKRLEKAPLIPVGDPRLEDCLHHHQ